MKERMKSILFVLALALVFVGAAKITEAKADIIPNYRESTVEIPVPQAVTGVYYQVVSTSGTAVKVNNWIPAAQAADDKYVIDFSALSTTKNSYIKYAYDLNADEEVGMIPLVAKMKSVKATLNYTKEDPSGLYDVIAKLDVKGVDKDDNRVWPDTTTDGEWNKEGLNLAQVVDLGWKRGANGDWKSSSQFSSVEWQMMKSANSTLYIRVEQIDVDADGEMVPCYYSKEAKVKVPKTAKAPTVKVDYAKGTIAIKNGMEFRVKTSNIGGWVKVGIKDKNATTGSAFNVEKTALAKTSVTMAELKKQLKLTEGATVTLEIRTAATDKKFMSYAKEVTITLPVAAPQAAGTNIKSAVSGGMITFALDKITGLDADKKYEYVLSKGDIDVSTTKFVAFDGKALEVKPDKKPSYKYLDAKGSSKSGTAKYSEVDTLWIREVGVPNSTDATKLKFAGEVAKITLE